MAPVGKVAPRSVEDDDDGAFEHAPRLVHIRAPVQ